MNVRPYAIIGGALLWFTSLQASANDLPLETTVRIGQPARDVPLRVANGDGGVDLSVGTARHTLTGVTAANVASEVVALSGGASVLLLTLNAGSDPRLVVVGSLRNRPAVIWNDRDGLRGDPGERRGHVLVREDRDGDGIAELGFVEHHETVRTCANELVAVRARWLNPRTLSLEPPRTVVAPLPPPASDPTRLEAGSTAPEGFAQHPRVNALRARWTDAGASMEPLTALPDGSALLDRNPDTAITLGGRSAARITWGVSAVGMAPRGLAITVTGAPSAAGTPRELRLRGDDGAWFHVTLPGTAVPTRHWISLPAGRDWRCLEIAAPATAMEIAVSEVELFTDLDAPDGLTGLIGRVVTDDRNGTEAARLLVSLGRPGIDALAAAWESLGNRGKRRTVLALQDRVATSAEGRSLLARAASDADPDLTARALASLISAPDAAFPELIALATHAGPGAEAAIRALGKTPRAEAAAALLALLASPTKSVRQAAKKSLEAMVAVGNEQVAAAVQTWLGSAPPRAAQTSALASLASHPATRASAHTIWTTLSAADDLEFDDLWRLVIGTTALAASPEVDAWLAHLAEHDERWMLRDAALATLRSRSPDQAAGLALGRLDDEYPRVRARAVAVLAASPGQQATLRARFAAEPWPLVRTAIVSEVSSAEESRTLRLAALRDSAPQVRIAAITTSERLGDATLWPEIAPLVRSNDEWPAVIGAAIQLASTRCITAATPDLRVVLKRGLKPDAWAPDVDLAMQAIDTLGRFGTPDAKALLRAAQSPEQPPAVRDAATRAANQAACQPTSVRAVSADEAPTRPAIAAPSTSQ